VIDRMKELSLDTARIGVSGLGGLLRAPEGTVVAGMLERRRVVVGAHERLLDAPMLVAEADLLWSRAPWRRRALSHSRGD